MESVKDNNVCKIEDNLGVKDNTEGVHRLGFQVVMIVSWDWTFQGLPPKAYPHKHTKLYNQVLTSAKQTQQQPHGLLHWYKKLTLLTLFHIDKAVIHGFRQKRLSPVEHDEPEHLRQLVHRAKTQNHHSEKSSPADKAGLAHNILNHSYHGASVCNMGFGVTHPRAPCILRSCDSKVTSTLWYN